MQFKTRIILCSILIIILVVTGGFLGTFGFDVTTAAYFMAITGALLNIVAVSRNGYRMPVFGNRPPETDDGKHIFPESHEEVKSYYLTDIFVFKINRKEYITSLCFSFGDLLIYMGIAILVTNSILFIGDKFL